MFYQKYISNAIFFNIALFGFCIVFYSYFVPFRELVSILRDFISIQTLIMQGTTPGTQASGRGLKLMTRRTLKMSRKQ